MQKTKDIQEELVSRAFSRQSPQFDHIYTSNAVAEWMRGRARQEVIRHIMPEGYMLELNCGTGMDTTWFAKKGINVLATDNAPGMLAALTTKVKAECLVNRVEIRQCSFNNLEQLQEKRFDYIFSNFGGLNCTDKLEAVLRQAGTLLKPGGYCTFVIMPVICPWELLLFFKGYFKTAFRRFRKNGTDAHIEGVHFTCYYYNPSVVYKALREGFEPVSLKGMAFLMPPPFIARFREKYPRLFKLLEKMENKLCDKFPFNRCCDHYIITLKKMS